MLAAVLPALMLAVLLPTHAEAAPSQPSKPTASSSDGVMTVNWVATTGATNGYQYRYSISSLCLPAGFNCDFEDKDKDWTDHGDAKDDTTLTLNELPTGRTYYFQVRGYDSNGATENDKYGPASGVSGGAFHRAAPGKLTGLTATPRSQQVTLNWHDPLAGDAVFNYDYRVDAGGGFPITWITVAPDSSEFTVTELTNGTTYGFQVRARNNGGEGPVSDTVTATPSGPPAAPVDLVATPGNKQVKLQWFNPSDSNIDKYQIQYGPGDNLSQWADISGSDATTTTHTVDGLANGTEYTFQLRAVDGDRAANDQAGPESSVTATPNDATPPPAKMVNVQQMVSNVTDGSEGEVKFTWDAPTESSTVTGYQYRYDETDSNPVGAWKQVRTAVPGDGATIKETTISLSGLGATIFFQLRAVGSGGDGEATAVTVEHSNTPSETTTTPPSKPTSLMATATPGQVALSWTAPSGTRIRFQYRQSTDDGGSWSPDWTDIPTRACGHSF